MKLVSAAFVVTVHKNDLGPDLVLFPGLDEILEWCFITGHRPNAVQQGIWNAFTSKMGWNDDFSPFMEAVKAEDGLANRDDLKTIFAVMDFREGRVSENHDLSL
jgi:hypothetical protein